MNSRILVLQLARFGDIYQSWPTLKALKRLNPEAEVHVLVRQRFRSALEGLGGIVVHTLPSAEILGPIVESADENQSLKRLTEFAAQLASYNFTRIINLSFSPFSSYLSDFLAPQGSGVYVRGYSRAADGYLAIPDDASAYFYAQAQLGGHNRFHITDIFASVAGVDLIEADYPALPPPTARQPEIIVHLGASQANRLYPAELWVKVLKQICSYLPLNVTLVGGKEEWKLAQTVMEQVDDAQLANAVGTTSLWQLVERINNAVMVIGCDSAPAQIASLTSTPVLHLTSATANFWTTGPISAGTRILHNSELDKISPDRISREAIAMYYGRYATGPCIRRLARVGSFAPHDLSFDDFPWQLIEALYTNKPFPETSTQEDLIAIQRLFELSELALSQLKQWKEKGPTPTGTQILAQTDLLIREVGRMNPRIEPIVQWFETERLRIPSVTKDEVMERTIKIFSDLHLISSVYRRYAQPEKENQRVVALCKKLTPALREYDFVSVNEQFNDLISTLHELSRHSTKVGDSGWSELLTQLNGALERRDYVEVADQLEYVLVPALS
jgi:heptosyltransferase III